MRYQIGRRAVKEKFRIAKVKEWGKWGKNGKNSRSNQKLFYSVQKNMKHKDRAINVKHMKDKKGHILMERHAIMPRWKNILEIANLTGNEMEINNSKINLKSSKNTDFV